jgi:hypothetical protein
MRLGWSLLGLATLFGCRGAYEPKDGDGDFLSTGRTLSFFEAVQIDPPSEDSAGPQFVRSADLNNDGYADLVSAWNQSQPVQIHLQRRAAGGGIGFETLTLAGNIPVVSVAGLTVADFDRDGRSDIAVLVKHSAVDGATCLDSETPPEGLSGQVIVYLAPEPAQADQALAWLEIPIGASLLQGRGGEGNAPEVGGFTAMASGDMDQDGDEDLVVAWNTACGGGGATAVIFVNQGAARVRDGTWIGAVIPDAAPIGSLIKDVALGDIDRDGDLDVVAAYPDAPSINVRWYRNPTQDAPDDYHISDGAWQVGTVAHIATQADAVRLGDIDRDGILDVLVRSSSGRLLQWLKGPEGPTTAPLRNIPWQVYTLAEFPERIPEAIALGDLDADGRLEVIVGAQGGLAWFDGDGGVHDQWIEHLIIDDLPAAETDDAPVTTDPNVEPTEIVGASSMNSIEVVDLDGNGMNDMVVTLDRAGLSGLTNDALVWFRNTRRPPND